MISSEIIGFFCALRMEKAAGMGPWGLRVGPPATDKRACSSGRAGSTLFYRRRQR
ncbi:hypothetical protein J27TS7_11520 [Paenibacillus dendritiformis]|nr:hypothetical protein J27TS7_11520 [Paenibacillus dendritiformis]